MQLYAELKLGLGLSRPIQILFSTQGRIITTFFCVNFLRNHVQHRTDFAQRSLLYHEDALSNNPCDSRYRYYNSTTLLYACSDSVYNLV